MKTTGKVIKLKPPFAFVRSSRPESCEHCANSAICSKKEVEICAYNDIGAEPGDYVVVETNEDRTAPLILSYLFLTPLFILFLCYYLYTIFWWLVFSVIPLTVIYYVILRDINRKHPIRARIIAPTRPPHECNKFTADNEEY